MSSKNFTGAFVARMAPTAKTAGVAAAALALFAPLASAQCPTDDDAATNDDCASAQSVATGLSSGYAVTDVSEDWYTISVPAGDEIAIDVLFIDATADIDVRLFDDGGTCSNQVASGGTSSDNESVSYTNSSMAAVDVTLRVFLFAGTCNDYELDIAITTPPVCAADAFAPNGDCMSAAPITPGSYMGLNVDSGLRDYYSITIGDGEEITVDLTFLDADGDIDLRLYDAGGCDLFGSQLDSSTSSTDNESVSYLNTTGADQDLIIRCRRFGSEFCTPYAMDISVVVPPCEDDDMMTNDDCASAQSISTGTSLGTVTDVSDDWYSITVPDGFTLTVNVIFTHADGDIDIALEAPCGTFIDDSKTVNDSESVSWANLTGADVDAKLYVYLYQFTASTCNDYRIEASLFERACLSAMDDPDEDNDTCMTAVMPPVSPAPGLFVSSIDEDFYSFDLMPGDVLDVRLDYINSNGDVDAQILDASDCTTVLVNSDFSFSDFEDLTYTNTSAGMETVVLRILIDTDSMSNCNVYDLTYSVEADPCVTGPDDGFEDNDTCMDATALTAGTYPGLYVKKDADDPDWYSVLVPNSATIDVDLAFISVEGDVDTALFDACGGTQLDFSGTILDSESMSWFNNTGARQTVYIHVFVWAGDNVDCQPNYELTIDLNGGSGTDFVDFCFGDGSGTACPCGNDASMGSGGGCLNSNLGSAVLAASGTSSISADDLEFSMTDGAPISFALLTAGINKLNGGLGIMEGDGLRCVGGELVRLEVRALDALGATVSNWGSGMDSLQDQFASAAMASMGISPLMAGQTRHFQAVYRDAATVLKKLEGSVAGVGPVGGCGTGLNRSQAVSVTFLP